MWLSWPMDSNYVNGGGMWFAIALINAGLAEQKNRSRLAWFLMSMFLGPFATLLVVVLPPPEAQKPNPRRSSASG
jgi:hypothetical protein